MFSLTKSKSGIVFILFFQLYIHIAELQQTQAFQSAAQDKMQ